MIRTQLLVLVALIAASTSGCVLDRQQSYYVFAKQETCHRLQDNCRYVATGAVELSVSKEKQQVSLVFKSDSGEEPAFVSLTDCTVIGAEDYSCEGLTMVDAQFTDTSTFGDWKITSWYPTYAASRYLGRKFELSTLEFTDRYQGWLNAALIVIGFLLFVGLLSS